MKANTLTKKQMIAIYKMCKHSEVGEEMRCPGCGKIITKKSYQHKFCNQQCKDHYWNTVDPRKKNRHNPPSHYRKYNVGEKSYANRLGKAEALKRGYPTYEDMLDAEAMDDPSWESGGGVYVERCPRCGMVYQHCRCPEIPD